MTASLHRTTQQDVVEIDNLFFPDNREIFRRPHRRSIRRGNYERPERYAIGKRLKPEDRVLELGAGIGVVGTEMVQNADVSHVVSFEANPLLIPFLREVHQLNNVADRIELRNQLVAPSSGPALPFYVRGDFLASSLTNNRGDRFGGVQDTVMIEQVAMSDVVAEIQPTALVCDIEGAELELLTAVDLTPFRIIVLELHPDTIGLKGIRHIFEAMSAAGLAYDPGCSTGAVVTFLQDGEAS